jgi:hypothetical protein
MSSGGSTSNTSSQSQSGWTPNSAASPGYGFIGGNTTQLMQEPVPYFPGQTYVGPSSLTQQGVAAQQMGAQAMIPTLQQAAQNYGSLSNAADISNNKNVQDMMAANNTAATDWLNQTALPTINSGAQSVNAMGSDRQGLMQGQAAGEAQKNLLSQNAATQMDAYTAGLGAQQSALGQTGSMLSNYLQPAGALGQAGQTVEGYQGAALQDAMNRYSYQYQEPWQRMQNTGSSLGFLQPLGTSYGSSYGSQPNANQTSPWQTVGGLGLMAAGAATTNPYLIAAGASTTGSSLGGYH